MKVSIYFCFGAFTVGIVHGLCKANILSLTMVYDEF